MDNKLSEGLHAILKQYQDSLTAKVYDDENDDYDLLMEVFKLTPALKRENRQYWGRELGMCWQLIVTKLFQETRSDFGAALRFGKDEPCDFVVGQYAIDTKYRIGSGDSGTLKKFKSYGSLLREKGYEPVFLILREDNLPAAISACKKGTWQVLVGNETFQFIKEQSGFDLKTFLSQIKGDYTVDR
ncbi:MAG: restriction endonuclease [Anaerolineae bacterium]|nr:restriction endonuclease [Anaerolineae bacterium]MDQ7033630.1 restriction endonuclease [Anaerolineae bacterium]